VIAVNLTGVFIVSKYMVPVMREAGGGSIINTSSAVALAGASRYAAYVASKGAIVSLTRSMAAMHGRHGIRVNAICPGILETALSAGFLEKEEDRQSAIRWHILRRLGSPEDVVGLVVYLASDESSWMTGAVIPIDGGATAK
jgi:NAD(P)-dependent dehydrogenase (short-subunit alcohol dehydrogenase family)